MQYDATYKNMSTTIKFHMKPIKIINFFVSQNQTDVKNNTSDFYLLAGNVAPKSKTVMLCNTNLKYFKANL